MFKKPIVFISIILFSLSFFTFAQDTSQDQTGLELELKAYIVSTIQDKNGKPVEVFAPASRAEVGQIIEYRVTAVNAGDTPIAAGKAKITVPIPSVTSYIDASATEGDVYRLEFSADGGQNFAVAPLMKIVKNDKGEEIEVVIEAGEYQFVRWIILKEISPKESQVLSLRVKVN